MRGRTPNEGSASAARASVGNTVGVSRPGGITAMWRSFSSTQDCRKLRHVTSSKSANAPSAPKPTPCVFGAFFAPGANVVTMRLTARTYPSAVDDGLERERAAAATDALVRDPIHEKRHVPRFLDQHDLENVGQGGDEHLHAAREAEDAETEERVDAFLVAEVQERALRRDDGRNGPFLHADAVMVEHHGEQSRVARFLHTLHGHRFADRRIRQRLGVCRDHPSRIPLGRERDAPKGNRTQAVYGSLVEDGPGKFFRLEAPMRLDKGATEEGFVGLRAVGHVGSSRDVASDSFSIDWTVALAIAFGVATFVLHIAVAGGYGYQRDELYFISCARHLAFGYVDQPPLIALVAKLALTLFGDSLYGLRLLPALAAAATVVVTGRLAWRLGGGPVAQTIAMLGIALTPFYLAVGNLLTMNAFEPLLWVGAAYLFFKADESRRAARLGDARRRVGSRADQ